MLMGGGVGGGVGMAARGSVGDQADIVETSGHATDGDVTIHRFNESEWDYDVRSRGRMRHDLFNPYNWVRFYLDRYLSGLGAASLLWLDCDTLVLADLTPLFRTPLHSPLAAVYSNESITNHLCPSVQSSALPAATAINAGVLLMRFDVDWKRIRREWLSLKRRHEKRCIWRLPSQPELQLLVNISSLSPRWNAIYLGSERRFIASFLSPSAANLVSDAQGRPRQESLAVIRQHFSILHWAGPKKPWSAPNAYLGHIWRHAYHQHVRLLRSSSLTSPRS